MKRDTAIKALSAFCGATLVLLGVWLWEARSGAPSEAEFAALAVRASSRGVPVDFNPSVRRELRRILWVPWKLQAFRCGMGRFESLRAVISEELRKRSMPEGLLALPMNESDYRNVSDGSNGGIWHLATYGARINGLIINEKTDERLDLLKSTDVALRLLAMMQNHFRDWRLTILGYYSGSDYVYTRIEELGVRDAWRIEASRPKPDPYLARFAARAILMEYASDHADFNSRSSVCRWF